MAASSVSRKAARQQLATLLTTGLTSAQQVNRYKLGEFVEGPTVNIYSGGTGREQLGQNQESWHNTFILVVDIWIPDAGADSGWIEEEVEDLGDDLNKELSDVIADNRVVGGVWDWIKFEDGYISQIFEVTTKGGQNWIIERYRIEVEVYE